MDIITSKENLLNEANEISSFLNTGIETSIEDLKLYGEELLEKGDAASVYVARTGDMLADAKYHLNEIMKTDVFTSLIQQLGANFLAASAQKAFINSCATRENRLVDKIERLNRSCVHQLEWYRSALSTIREKIRQQNISH